MTGSTLSAPIPFTSFNYHYNFLLNGSGEPYSHIDFDGPSSIWNPETTDHTVAGTVGWYYGGNNTMEDNVPITDFPYSRTEFYNDGTGEVKRQASPGDQHRLGAGHETLSGTFPVYNELDYYLSYRTIAIPDITQDGSLSNEAVQAVGCDENGKYSVSITDKSGRTVMTARAGASNDKVLEIPNHIDASADPTSPNYHPIIYFYLLSKGPVSLQGDAFQVEDIVHEQKLDVGQTFADQSGDWPAGFYRVILNSGTASLSYSNFYNDIAWQFYDDAGRLRVSVSPKGFKYLKENPSAFDKIDKTTYKYNHRGWLLEMTEPDAGTTRYVYRKDGKIRFSQNAQQKQNSDASQPHVEYFSYTHYDELGRPVESGEYQGNEQYQGIDFKFVSMDSPDFSSSAMAKQLELTWDQVNWLGVKKDWQRTHYDLEIPSSFFTNVTPLPSTEYTQDFLSGAVSWTENANNTTWYCYDELGKVTWMAQKPTELGLIFVTKYEYDFLGNVKKTDNLSYVNGQLSSKFYHHYEYDADKRLVACLTSSDGIHKKLRAKYQYYLHGPLKRIELAENMQGIDFVYNINGWLTQINHPNINQDPGHDGVNNNFRPDAFGMTLDYYQSEVSELFPTSVNPMETNDPLKIHHLPILDSKTVHERFGFEGLIRYQSELFVKKSQQMKSQISRATN